MAASAHDAYLEHKILSADPAELVAMLYAKAIESVERARRHLAAGRIADRSSAISKAVEILMELNASLDPARAPEMCGRLAGLYDYMERRLLDANFRQSDAPLAEVLGLLGTLAEAWKTVSGRGASLYRPPAEASWTPPAGASEPQPDLHCWSF